MSQKKCQSKLPPHSTVESGRVGPVTDLSKWRLSSVKGRQTWVYDEEGESKREPTFIEMHALGLDTVRLCTVCIGCLATGGYKYGLNCLLSPMGPETG